MGSLLETILDYKTFSERFIDILSVLCDDLKKSNTIGRDSIIYMQVINDVLRPMREKSLEFEKFLRANIEKNNKIMPMPKSVLKSLKMNENDILEALKNNVDGEQ